VEHPAGLCSGKALNSHSETFVSNLGLGTGYSEGFRNSPQSLQSNAGMLSRLDDRWGVSSRLQFVSHLTFQQKHRGFSPEENYTDRATAA
jgi:hypothetical protein